MHRALDHFMAPLFLGIGAFAFQGCGSSGGGGGNPTVPPVTIGPSGGTFDDGSGVKVTVPARALSINVQISATRTNAPATSGYGALSNLYDFQPAGLTFSQPVTVTLPLPSGVPANVTIYWSQKGNSSAYDDVNGVVTGSSISAQVTHFSTGFVGTLLSMANWVHVAHPHWNYWKPTDQWLGTESTSGIDISSPTGDADASFGFVYGPLVPTTVDQGEALGSAGGWNHPNTGGVPKITHDPAVAQRRDIANRGVRRVCDDQGTCATVDNSWASAWRNHENKVVPGSSSGSPPDYSGQWTQMK